MSERGAGFARSGLASEVPNRAPTDNELDEYAARLGIRLDRILLALPSDDPSGISERNRYPLRRDIGRRTAKARQPEPPTGASGVRVLGEVHPSPRKLLREWRTM